MIIPDYVEKNVKLFPNKTALIFEDRRITFTELKERVYRLSNGLLELGVKKGDRVAIIQDNCFEYPEMYYGISKIGAIITPLNYRLIGRELTFLINDSEANTLIIGKDFVEIMKPFQPELKFVKNYICIGDKPEGMINYDELVDRSSTKKPEVQVEPDDVSALLYTGGTTGRPKGVVLTHRNWTTSAITHIVELGLSYGDTDLIVTPLFHVGSRWPLFYNFSLGNTEIVLKRVDAEEILRTVEKEKVTIALWIVPVIRLLINNADLVKKYNASSLKLIVTGGAPISGAELKRFIELFNGVHVSQGSGQTETGKTSESRVNYFLDDPEKINVVGREAFNVEMRVVDDKDNDVPLGGVGEMIIRSEGVMKEYWKMPEETAEALKGGWHHTGDLVKIDKDRFVTYVDRKKDMIITGGENVYSKDVEDVIYEHKAVAEAAVIGIPDEKWGELIKALVVLKEREKATEQDIIAHCKERLTGFKCPKSVEFRDSFPKTGLGKIAKNVLRGKYWEGYERKIH